ncbi:MAG: DNA topoisomerase VI subunit B [Deltaproteobacteria bacterium]|nr:DNA topoisomerase VI subunit B [Deltaproteobacteria bacterium]
MAKKNPGKSEQLSLMGDAAPAVTPAASRRRQPGSRKPPATQKAELQLPVMGPVELASGKAPVRPPEPPAVSAAPEPKAESEAKPRRAARGGDGHRRASAESMAARQRDISVAEFFTKNRHLLGFDNPAKALLTTVKEAVDNALDAGEEAGILPEIDVAIAQVNGDDRYRVTVRDNGPGIVKAQIARIFGKLLYGSKFHSFKQARGQQGIGISAAGMYGQLTTGRPMTIVSRTGKGKPAFRLTLRIDTQKNQPETLSDEQVEWEFDHGTQVEIELTATYRRGSRSVEEYLQQVAIANPHARITYRPPAGQGDVATYERVSQELPREAKEMKPHPYGVELGMLLKMLLSTKSRTIRAAMVQDFSRVSSRVADEICAVAGLKPEARATRMAPEEVEALHKAMQQVKILAPPTACVVPIGEELMRRGLESRFKGELFTSSTRPPSVYRGNPFVVEVGLAYGGDIPADEPCDVMRFANRVPLQYQKGACAITEAVTDVAWRNYGLSQPRGSLPIAPMVLAVHVASVWVPFTSESKEAIAHYPEILRELKLALQECGRRVAIFLSARRRAIDAGKKRAYIQKYIPHISGALREILGYGDAKERETVECLEYVLERSRLEGMKAVADEIASTEVDDGEDVAGEEATDA